MQYSTDDGSNWITAGTLDDSNDSNSNVCTTFSVTILGASVPTSSDLKFQVLNNYGAGDYYFYIDNFNANQVAACPQPTALAIDSFTATTAEISWTAGASETDWEIAVQTDGTGTPGSGTATTSNPYSATGLTAETAYEVYVRADCGGSGTSNWVGPVDFTTPCAVISADYTADMTTNVPDACWREAASGEVAAGPGGIGASDWDDNRNYGGTVSNSVNLYAATDKEWLLSPAFDVSGVASEIVVEVALTDYASATNPATMGSDDEVQLLSSVDNGVTWTAITTWNASNEPDVAGTTFTAALPSATNIQFAIWASDGTTDDSEDYDFHIGDFKVRAIPACPDVAGLTIDSFTAETAEISWTAGGSETDWEVLVQADGTGSPASGVATTSNPYSATGLSELTAYEVYVRSDCGGGQLGAWVGPVDFTTEALCPKVSGITIDSFTGDSVTVSWTNGASETDWEVLVQADGTGSPASGIATTTNPHIESGLTGNTAYEVYVRADCAGDGYSLWVGPVDFTTSCTAIVPDYTADMSTNVPDACWTEANDGEVAAGHSGSGTSDWTSGSYIVGASNRINLYDNVDREWLLSPTFDLSADGYELIVNVGVTNWNSSTVADDMGSDDEVQLLMSIDGGTTWTNLTTWTAADAIQPSGTSYTEDLTGTTGTNVQFAIWASDGTVNDTEDYDFHIGEFIVREIPPCPDVSAIAVSNIGETTADVAWTNGGSETAWEVAIQAQGTGTPASGAASATNPYNATGLTTQTDYEVYVRSDCGGGAYGAWAGPIDFTTSCATFSLPLVEGFESGVPPACWSSFIGTNGEGTGFDWTTIAIANSGFSAAIVRYENVATGAEDWLVTPALDMTSTTNPELSFYASQDFASDYGTTYTIRVSTTNTDHASFSTVETYTEADFSVDNYDQYSVDLSAYAGQATVYVAFVMEQDDGDNWLLDDVVIYDNVPTTFTYTSGTWAPFNPMGLAASDDDIVIAAGDYVMDADMSCDRFDVSAGASLTIDSGVTLTTNDILQLSSTSTSYSSLILDGSVVGPILYDRHVNINGSGTTGSNDLISAPLTGQAFSVVAAGNPNILNNGTLYLFGPFEKNTGQYVNWAGTETATLDAGVGYRAGTSDNTVVTFGGTAENGTITNDIINGGTNNEEWNLIGNPYPSYMSVADFLNHDVGGGTTNINLFDVPTAAIYGYDGSALNGWTVINLANAGSRLLAPGQGFFVSANAASTGAFDVEFTPAMRRTGSGDDFIVGRNAQLSYLILNVSANDKSYHTDLYFNVNASEGFDAGYDAGIWGDTTPDFGIYSHLVQDNVGQPIALQTLNPTNLTDVTIPLGVNANQGEQLTFSIADMTLPTSVNVYLEDIVKNTVTLLNNSDYVFTPTTDLSGTGRFFLRTSEDALSTIDNSYDTLNIFALNNEKELVVKGQLKDNTVLSLYDIQGREVLTAQLDNSSLDNRIDTSELSAGVYIVNVQNLSLIHI